MKNWIMDFTRTGVIERAMCRQAEARALGIPGISLRFVDTSILSANRLTQEMWPQTKFEIMLANMQLSKFIGGTEDIITMDTNLKKGHGDKVTMELDMPLSDAGGFDDSTIEDNEEAMSFFNFPVEVHERSHGVRSAGIMSEKRSAVKIRTKAIFALARWSAEQVDNDALWGLSGLGNQNTFVGEGTSPIQTVNEKAPSSGRIFFGGQTVAGVVTEETSDSLIADGGGTDYNNYLFGTKVIDIIKDRAVLAFPKIKPVFVGGKWYYVMFLHPFQVKSLKAETGAAGWAAIQKDANVRGINNPLFTKDGTGRERMFDGAVGVWNDVILFAYERIETRVAGESFGDPNVGTNVIDATLVDGTAAIARALFCGAQAGALAWAKTWRRLERGFDYKRKPGTATDAIYGFSKVRFNDPGANQSTNTAQEDFGIFVVDTAVVNS